VFTAVSTLRGERVYPVTGIVRAPFSDGRLVVAHQDIAGYMPAMTMSFAIAPGAAADASRLRAGDRIAFALHVDDNRAIAGELRLVGHATVDAAPPRVAAVTRVHEGDPVPNFSLVDERNRPLTSASLTGHFTVLTFIFTRCPVPEFCPLVVRRFAELQRAIASEAVGSPGVRLLCVTLDPEYDRPNILADYSAAVGADPKIWTFATGAKPQVEALVAAFSVYTERNGVTLNHTLCTALIDPSGRIVEIWRGNGWTAPEVLAVQARRDSSRR
jgi:protein SCO1/2